MARKFAKSFYQSEQWQDVRDFVFNRDFGICQCCGKLAKIVHHIIWLNEQNIGDVNVTLNPANLISVCKLCHDRIHSTLAGSSVSFDNEGNVVSIPDAVMERIEEIRERNRR